MNITFLIGNGFDLNLGLDTGYKDFLKYYLSQETIDPKTKKPDKDIQAFKNLISNEIEYWSDLEKALGAKTIESPLNTVEGIVKCKRDLDRSLKEYLKKQQDRVDFSSNQSYVSKMEHSISGFPSLFKKATKPRIDKVFSSYKGENVTYNAISFNYTNIFDKCFLAVNQKIGHYIHNGKTCYYQRGRVIHAHGTTDSSMIVGVNDESQIANKDLASDRLVKRFLIKPHMNNLSEDLRDEDAINILENSAIIVVFGMSLGKTDKLWWEIIAERMITENRCILILADYQNELDNSFVYEVEEAKEKGKEKFFAAAGLNNDHWLKIKDRVFVFFNTPLFKLDFKLKLEGQA